MRIIAGEWRGRKLAAPHGLSTRPTADRTRETLFSMLASRLGSFDGLTVADLFAGSGALGLEALSRGAAHATFVETDSAARRTIEANAAAFRAQERISIRAHSATALPSGRLFDLILADPPYGAGAGSQLVRAIAATGWLAPGGWLAIETARGDAVDPADYVLDAERDTGRARLTLLRRGS
ncbi:16S rRNA (guanine(966)-N(2))-methyltransferase RsmD [Sphingomonas sp. GCM10030256]|uniref:16S rRNA (guanine(966)-N(2))-methyltransferase RsmD n=1 Tax=Sphingomonas sp. GCM10030256 TaxID=3273427 RepID=UPI00360F1831